MNREEIINLALENLRKNARIKGEWEGFDHPETDGRLRLDIDDKQFNFNIEIKDEWRNHQIQQIIATDQNYPLLMVVGTRFFPKIKEELRHNNIAYLEANGNIFLKNKETTLWIETNKQIETDKITGSRAFTKTGLKVVFQFLIDETWLNKPYRKIAAQTGTGIGNMTNIITGLKQDGFLLPIAKNEYKLTNKEALLHKWIAAYDLRLKQELKIGTFRFLKEEDFFNWKNLPLRKGKTWWGGEPAGELLTDFIRPAELTLYTIEARTELIKNYRLIPDDNGNVKAYNKFWKDDSVNAHLPEGMIVPVLLVYADLINTNDRRCTETAQKVYDAYLQNKF